MVGCWLSGWSSFLWAILLVVYVLLLGFSSCKGSFLDSGLGYLWVWLCWPIEFSTSFLVFRYEIFFECFISDIFFPSFTFHKLLNQLHGFISSLCISVVVHSPFGLFYFFHIFYILEVWCIFLSGAQIFGRHDIWTDLECMFLFQLQFILFLFKMTFLGIKAENICLDYFIIFLGDFSGISNTLLFFLYHLGSRKRERSRLLTMLFDKFRES